jgi:hypothetical protein
MTPPRKSRRVRNALAGSLLLVPIGTWAFFRAGPSESEGLPLPLKRVGVTVARLEAADVSATSSEPEGTAAVGAPGDWLIETDTLRLVVGSDAEGVERSMRHGVILDLTAEGGGADKLLDIIPVLEIEGRTQALRAENVMPVGDGPSPYLRIMYRTRDDRVRVETDVKLERGRHWAELVTRVGNTGGGDLKLVRIGDRVRWPGVPTFAPRLGFVKFTSRAEVPWIARRGSNLSYALAFPESNSEVSFQFDRIGSVAQIAFSPGTDLAAGAVVEHRRLLVASNGGLSKLADVVWPLTGRRVGKVHGVVKPAPSWATIEAQHPDGHPVLSVTTDQRGAYELPLPAGHYTLVLKTPGGEDRQDVTIDVGGSVEVRLLAPAPGALAYALEDENERPLAGRFIVRGINGTPDPDLGHTETVSGAKNVFYTMSGKGTIELAAGDYQVTATHGLEYSIESEIVSVTPETGAAVRFNLERVVDTSGWLACDFHLHQAPSFDSNVSLDDRVISLFAEGVEFAVATDHNHITDLGPSARSLGLERDVSLATGVEITTPSWGHFIAFPYPKHNTLPPYASVDPPEIFAAVRARAPGAVIQVNHPRLRGIGYFNRIELDAEDGVASAEGFSFDFDTVEVVNGLELGDPKALTQNLEEWFALLNKGYRYTAVGNSDSHRLVYQWAGYPRTYVRVNDDEPQAVQAEEVARALIAGRAIVSNGPFVYVLVDGEAEPGDQVSADGGRVTLQVSVRAPQWIDVDRIEVFANGVRVASKALPPSFRPGLAGQWETELEIDRDTWIVVMVRGKALPEDALPGLKSAPFGFANPIYIDGDGDGAFRAPDVADKHERPRLGGIGSPGIN